MLTWLRQQARCCLLWGMLFAAAGSWHTTSLHAAESYRRVTFQDDSKQIRTLAGRVLLTAQDGGILLQGRDGRLWTISPEQISEQVPIQGEFKPLTHEELGKELVREFGPAFGVTTTKHYVICANTDKSYAEWCAKLFERLRTSFVTYWGTRGIKLTAPEFPLPVIIFENEKQFAKFAASDASAAAATSKGYYSIPTNRIVLYDLTAGDAERPVTSADIERRLEQVPFNVATVVHEATHQIAFNSGLHQRYADNPLWLTEGMAMYFETPDLKSRTGWKTAGAVNDLRAKRFRDYVAKRRANQSLFTLLQADNRFTEPQTAEDAYAEAWALSYFLIKTRSKAYVEYLKRVADKPQLRWDAPQDRLVDFQAAFGMNLEELETEFLKYTQRWNKPR